MDEALLKEVKFDGQGLVPAIAQHYRTGEILDAGLHERREPAPHHARPGTPPTGAGPGPSCG
ncbi:MAG: hypothetical protein MZV49_00525 [Rhodopseudomonas palustris]|nr:hypothetical protein [Rhodopseudomonas palustris]